MRVFWITLGLAVILCVTVSAADTDDSAVAGIDDQGHENTSGRKARQFGFGFPPPPGPGFGGPGFGGPGFGGGGFGGGGFGGPGFGGGGFGGPGFGGTRQRVRFTERVRTRQRVTVNNGFGGGFYG